MDFHLKQWRDHNQQDQESEDQQPSPAKFPRLFQLQVDNNQDSQDPPHEPALPLFAPTKINNSFSSYPDSKPPLPPTSSRLPCRGGGHFSLNQWQELELQALIFRHMAAGSVVPPELLQLVKKSLLSSPSYYLNNYSYYQPSLLQAAAGYWGRSAMDPEPGRCRRTDGKKWRCSRDVVAGQKYCERHVHRGRNRSRKPVEFPVPTAAGNATHSRGGADLVGHGGVGLGTQKSSSVFGSSQQQLLLQSGGAHFSLSGPTPSLDIFQLNQGASEQKPNIEFPFEPQSEDDKYNGKVLRRFFDDWPRSNNTNDGGGGSGASRLSPVTSLSISTPVANSSLDFLKLSTGNGEEDVSRRGSNLWGGESQVATMGGPLAEALRSSTGSSPTSVLNHIPRSASDTSYVT
ncbi:hypothetical protein V2J09_010672 [Rumex salicifolius]